MEGFESSDANLGIGDLVLDVSGDVGPAVGRVNEPELAIALGEVGNVSVGVLTSENGEAVNVLSHSRGVMVVGRIFLSREKSTIMKNNYIQTQTKSTKLLTPL